MGLGEEVSVGGKNGVGLVEVQSDEMRGGLEIVPSTGRSGCVQDMCIKGCAVKGYHLGTVSLRSSSSRARCSELARYERRCRRVSSARPCSCVRTIVCGAA